MTFRADLHCHSIFSDGTSSPEKLIGEAQESGLLGLAITDHDTIGAYARAMPYAKSQNFPLISGVEFSSLFEGESIHILGYAFALESPHIHALCAKEVIMRAERNQRILMNLKKLGIDLPEEEVSMHCPQGGVWGRPHIAHALVQRGIISSIKAGFDQYLAEGKPAYAAVVRPSCQEVIETIHEGGGKAVLAHPHLIKKQRILKRVLELPFDGLECYYARLPPDRCEPFLRLATQKKWLITGGSDYHGAMKRDNPLGASWVNEETFRTLHTLFLSHE